MDKIGQGRTAEIYALDDDRVLKLFRPDLGHKSVEHEYYISQKAAETGVPAPKIYEMVQYQGRQGIICQRIYGQTMLEIITQRPHKVLEEGRRLAKLQHQIHSHQGTEIPDLKDTLASFISRASVLTPEQREQILDHLSALPGGNSLCHGDFHPDNVLISPQGPVVIDWINATSGNPVADVARTSLLLSKGAPPPGLTKMEAGLLSILRLFFHRAYLREYRRLSNFSADQVEAWMLPVAAARLAEGIPKYEQNMLLRLVQQGLKN